MGFPDNARRREIHADGNVEMSSITLTVRKDLIDEGKVKTPCDLKGRKIGVASVQSGAEINVALALTS